MVARLRGRIKSTIGHSVWRVQATVVLPPEHERAIPRGINVGNQTDFDHPWGNYTRFRCSKFPAFVVVC